MFILVVASGCGCAYAVTRLQARATESREHVFLVQDVVSTARELDGLEWRAISGEPPDAIALTAHLATADLLDELRIDHNYSRSDELNVEVVAYTDAVRDEFTALTSGRLELAVEIDESRADPGFESLLSLADQVLNEQQAEATATEQTVRTWIWVGTLGIVTIVAGLLWAAWSTRERHKNRQRRAEGLRRFRSMVQSSRDVITIVSAHESLSVMSPSLGPLAGFGSEDAPDLVSHMLPPDAFNQWRAIDARLRADSGHHEVELTMQRPDGTRAWVEAFGSTLLDSPAERVWVWRDITERKQLELQLTHQAFHDGLTGVANRSLLRDRIDHALTISARSAAPVTLLFCDLDDFKTVNDTLGHARGDELLNVITKRIAGCVRDCDTVARLGGDEFAILLEDLDTVKATALAERLLSVISYEVTLDAHSIFPSMSIGIATAAPGATTDELLRNADLAMYSAKRSGKCRAAAFDDRMHETTTELLELQSDLHHAIAAGQLSVHYQPSISLETGDVESVEALLRWTHPVLGNIVPDRFIPIAESTGMIIAIGRWVLQQACHAAVDLQTGRSRPLLMHVNVSAQQLRDPTIVGIVRDALDEARLAPQLLVLEVTESFLLDDEVAIERLHQLHSLGVLIAIDDFGTGYTSIAYLQQLPIQILKIDRSFVSGDALEEAQRNAFLHAIIGLAKSLNLRSVAEGVEDLHQLEQLKQLGCDAGQGFLWSPAVPLLSTTTTIDEIESATYDVLGPDGARAAGGGQPALLTA